MTAKPPSEFRVVARAKGGGKPLGPLSHRISLISNRNSRGLFAGKWLRAPATTTSLRDRERSGGFVFPSDRRRRRPLSDNSPKVGGGSSRSALRVDRGVPEVAGLKERPGREGAVEQ